MEFTVDDYILGMWFAEAPNGDNWQMTIIKRDGKWLGEYRFRYKKDDKVWHSNDRKSFYNFKIPEEETEEEVLKKMEVFFDVIKIQYPRGEFISIKGDFNKFIFRMAQEPWFNIKKISQEDFEKEYGKEGGQDGEI